MSHLERTHFELLCKVMFTWCRVRRTRCLFWHSTPRGDSLRSVAATENEAYCPCQSFFFLSPLLSVFLSYFLYTTIKFEESKQEAVRKLSWVQFESRFFCFVVGEINVTKH
jgi:hypothetical protein